MRALPVQLGLLLVFTLLATASIAQEVSTKPSKTPPTDISTPAFTPITSTTKSAVVKPDLPYGMCQLDPQQDADRAAVADMHLASQSPSNLLGVYADCTQLKGLRAEDVRVPFLSHYATLVEQIGATVALNRASTLLVLSSSMGLTSAISAQATQATKAGFGMREASFHGILKQTPDFIIVGSEQRHIARNKEFAVAVISLITVIKGNIVTANFFMGLENADSFTKLAKEAEIFGNALITANP